METLSMKAKSYISWRFTKSLLEAQQQTIRIDFEEVEETFASF